MIRTDSDVSELTEFELNKRIAIRERQLRRLEKELKILRRVLLDKRRAAAPVHRCPSNQRFRVI